jgi:hypothetical protein
LFSLKHAVSKGAGTPVPLLPAAGTSFADLAVDTLPFTTYSQAWAVLGIEDALPTQHARLALRHLTTSTRCALTTLPAGKSNDAKAAQLLQDLKAAISLLVNPEARQHKSKQKTQAEVAALFCACAPYSSNFPNSNVSTCT